MTRPPTPAQRPRGLAGRLVYGGDYNPEQWPEDVWAEDVELMREAGVNLVSLGVFAWSSLEPREGTFEFGWLDRVLDRLHAAGIGVALATPTASPPPWFTFAHPDALPVRADGVRLTHGSRDTYCHSAPAYRDAARRIASAMGERYRDHPALALWHVHNEYGTSCHCDQAAAAFRRWLRARYGTLDRLNEAWTTAFWGQVYADWDHIVPPRATQYLSNPGQALDFRRFVSDELLACFREQRDVLRSHTPDVPITTNLVLGGWVPVDPWRWAEEVDVVAIDHYPSDAGPLEAEEETAFAADLARGWAHGRPWLLMEQAPNLIYAGRHMIAKEPGRMTRLTLSHVARGSRGAMFFQWRAPRGGAERFHSAMVPHAGRGTRLFAEVVRQGRILSELPAELGDAPVEAHAALLWDVPSWWALQGPGLPSPDLDQWAAARRVHASVGRASVTVDVAHPEGDLSAYRLVLVPSLYLVSDRAAAGLRSYVDGGGTLVVWYFSDVADVDGRVRPDGYPGTLHDVLGLRVEELHPLPPGDTVTLSTGATGSTWSELIRPAGAEVIAEYASGPLAGHPAITRNRFGAGHAWYVSTHLDRSSLDHFLGGVRQNAGVRPVVPDPVPGVEVVRRRGATGTWLFAINHTDAPATVGGLRLEPGGHGVLSEACNKPAPIDGLSNETSVP